MKTFYIVTSTPAIHLDYYEVKATTEEEAMDLIMKGKVEAYDVEIELKEDELEIVDVNIEDQDYTTPSHIFTSIKEYKSKTIKR